MFTTRQSLRLWLFMFLYMAFSGCGISPKNKSVSFGLPALSRANPVSSPTPVIPVSHRSADLQVAAQSEPSPLGIEYGQERPVIDGIGNVLGIPRKLMLWDRRADNHQVSEQTVGEVADYLHHHDLTDVKVRVNQYAPVDEWRRLAANKQMGAGWRYTVGVLKHLEYTLLPGRIWGGDEYNPYTNSVHLYSDVAPLGVVESAYANDVHQRDYPGTYAVVQEFPIVSLWHESLATREAMTYATQRSTSEDLAETRRLLYARYGMQVGGELLNFGPANGLQVGNFGEVIGAVGGHVAASIETHREARQPSTAQEDASHVVRGNR